MDSNPTNYVVRGAQLASVCVLYVALGLPPCFSAERTQAWLIMPEEAAMAPAPSGDGLRGSLIDVGRGDLDLGPIIEILKPSDERQAPSPLQISIRFAPRLSPIDLETLKVSIVKFVNIDITDRVKPYATRDGIELKEAKIPAGKHRVRISLGDTTGSVTVREVMLDVL